MRINDDDESRRSMLCLLVLFFSFLGNLLCSCVCGNSFNFLEKASF